MVVGNGLIAKTFNSYQEKQSVLIFASGISNSKEDKDSEFDREHSLLNESLVKYQDALFIYFSTCSVYDDSLADSKYINHKLNMEALVKERHFKYLIFRLPNVVGKGGNKNTLINHFVESIISGSNFNVWGNSTRNILDADDVYFIAKKIIDGGKANQIINIANPNNYKVTEIVEVIEGYFKVKGKTIILNKGQDYNIDVTFINDVLNELNKSFSMSYFKDILKKYY